MSRLCGDEQQFDNMKVSNFSLCIPISKHRPTKLPYTVTFGNTKNNHFNITPINKINKKVQRVDSNNTYGFITNTSKNKDCTCCCPNLR